MNFPEKRLCRFLNILIIYNQKKTNEPFLSRTDKRIDNGDFIGSSLGRRESNIAKKRPWNSMVDCGPHEIKVPKIGRIYGLSESHKYYCGNLRLLVVGCLT